MGCLVVMILLCLPPVPHIHPDTVYYFPPLSILSSHRFPIHSPFAISVKLSCGHNFQHQVFKTRLPLLYCRQINIKIDHFYVFFFHKLLVSITQLNLRVYNCILAAHTYTHTTGYVAFCTCRLPNISRPIHSIQEEEPLTEAERNPRDPHTVLPQPTTALELLVSFELHNDQLFSTS